MISLILLIIALICFLLSAASWPNPPRINLMGLGLAFWVLSIIISGAAGHPAPYHW